MPAPPYKPPNGSIRHTHSFNRVDLIWIGDLCGIRTNWLLPWTRLIARRANHSIHHTKKNEQTLEHVVLESKINGSNPMPWLQMLSWMKKNLLHSLCKLRAWDQPATPPPPPPNIETTAFDISRCTAFRLTALKSSKRYRIFRVNPSHNATNLLFISDSIIMLNNNLMRKKHGVFPSHPLQHTQHTLLLPNGDRLLCHVSLTRTQRTTSKNVLEINKNVNRLSLFYFALLVLSILAPCGLSFSRWFGERTIFGFHFGLLLILSSCAIYTIRFYIISFDFCGVFVLLLFFFCRTSYPILASMRPRNGKGQKVGNVL